MKARDWHPLTDEALAELTRRALAGEKRRDLAEEFDVPRSWVSAARATAKDPAPGFMVNPTHAAPAELLSWYADARAFWARAVLDKDDAGAKVHMATARAACRWWAAKTRTPKKEARAACHAYAEARTPTDER